MKKLHQISLFLAGLISLTGLLVIFGWAFHIQSIIQIAPIFAPMQFNTAFSIFSLGIAFIALKKDARKLAAFFSFTAATIGLLTFLEYLSGFDLKIDQLLMNCYLPANPLHPGRMAANTATCLFLLGSTFFMLAQKSLKNKSYFFTLFTGVFVAFLSFVAILNFARKDSIHYGWGNFADMAIHTAIALFFLGLGTIHLSLDLLSPEERKKVSLLPVGVSIATLIGTVILWQSALLNQTYAMKKLSLNEASAIQSQIIQGINSNFLSLERMARRLAVNPSMSHSLWEDDAKMYFNHIKIIEAIAVVSPEYQVKWFYPVAGNEKLLGFNLSQEPIRKAVLDRSRALQKPQVTPIVNLRTGGRGFGFVLPMFPKDHFNGFVSASFKPATLFAGIVKTAGYAVEVMNDQEILYSNLPKTPLEEQWSVTAPIDIYDHHWSLKVIPSMDIIHEAESGIPYAILATGIFISLILGFMIHLAMMSRRQTRIIGEQRNTLRGVINSSPLPIAVLGLDHKLQEWNPACERIFGWKKEEVIGKFFPFVNEESLPHSKDLIKRILESDERIEVEAVREKKDKSSIIIQISAMCLKDEKGKAYGLMAIMEDITIRKNTEFQLKLAREHAENAVRSKSEFLANMSHEIRTPLNGILGMADLLMDTDQDSDQKKYTKIIQNSGSSLLNLLNDILDLSKGEAGKIQLENSEFALTNLVEGQADMLIGRAREKSLSLMTFIAPELPFKITGDSSRLGQILLNLIGNAIKFTETGGVSVRVKTGTEVIPGPGQIVVRFEIEDTGIGVSEEGKSKLFQPFSQVDGSTARKYGGTGLGLSICRNFVETMGGKIGITSEAGKGSTFWFEIPTRGSSEAKEYKSDHRVLLVDHDAISQDVISRYLLSWKMNFDRLSPDQSAIETIHASIQSKSPYDIVILGHATDPNDVVKLGRQITHRFENEVKIIFLHEFDSVLKEVDLKSLGFKSILQKPLKQSYLYDAIVTTEEAFVAKRAPERVEKVVAKPGVAGHILVADDVAANQLLAVKFLQNLGYTAQAVANGKEVISALTQGNFDLILMDCHMPEMDGYETTRTIRQMKDSKFQTIPIIALTANAMTGDNEKCFEAGMNDYLSKPFKKEKLGQIVNQWLSKRKNTNAA